MTTTVKAYGTEMKSGTLKPMNIERRAPHENDVSIKILFCGICHTDIHTINEDWGENVYPVVPGHEIVGEVTAVGDNVSKFKVGDRVGVGFMCDSCQSCPSCKEGLENYCAEGNVPTCNGIDKHDRKKGRRTYGGYSKSIVVREEFVVSIPDSLDPAAAAPLLCAGITMYSPLSHWKTGKGKKVGIVGLGGLGHMGLKFAHAMGAEVTLFTRSKDKESDAKSFGADKVVVSTEKEQMKSVKNYFDLIVDTVPAQHDVTPYVESLGRDGTLVIVGMVGEASEKLNAQPLIFGRKSIAGSAVGGMKETQEMLDFCGKHNIVAEIEKVQMKDVNDAYERMQKSDLGHRFVIDISTL